MIVRRLRQLVLIGYACSVLVSVGLVVAAAWNDHLISANEGRALARVTHVDWLRTTVEFQDAEGIFHVPPTGVLYPSGLGEGQRVWVSYATDQPDLVKVEGRTWTLSVVPAMSVLLCASAVAALAWWLIGRAAQARSRAPSLAQPGQRNPPPATNTAEG